MNKKKRNQHIIEEKIYRRRRKKKIIRTRKDNITKFVSVFHSYVRFLDDYLKFFFSSQFISREYCVEVSIIESPKYFSFKKGYNDTIIFIRQYLSTYFFGKKHIILDFSKCEVSSIAAFTLLHIVIHQTELFKNKYNNSYQYSQCLKKVKFRFSAKDIKTNKFISAIFGIDLPSEFPNLKNSLYLPLDLIFGRKRLCENNMKGSASTKVTKFVNEALRKIGFELNKYGEKHIGNLIGEVLANCEDHCYNNSNWYIDGLAFAEGEGETEIVQLNISIVNVGKSMYEAFEETKEFNKDIYSRVSDKYKKHQEKFTSILKFEKESLYTLYLLNDGISRLKYKDSSRGNGTTRFLNSFITLGGIGNENKKYNSLLNIISGHTVITCDNEFKPIAREELMIIPLNRNNNPTELPDKKYLNYHEEYFPGTILECSIYINRQNMTRKFEKE